MESNETKKNRLVFVYLFINRIKSSNSFSELHSSLFQQKKNKRR